MKRFVNLGLTATIFAALVFASCTKDDDDGQKDDVVQKWQRKHLLSETCIDTTNDGVAHKIITEYKYDAEWHCLEDKQTFMNNDVIVSYGGSKYDERGLVLESESKWEESGETHYSKTTYKYNDFGEPIEYEVITDGVTQTEKHEIEYNDNGNIKTKKDYYNGELTGYSEYSYAGDTVKTAYYVGGNVYLSYVVYITINNEKKVKTEFFSDGSKREYYYEENKSGYDNFGENGQLLQERTTLREGNVVITNYNDYKISYSYNSKTVYTDSSHEKILTFEKTETSASERKKYIVEWELMLTFPITERTEYTYNDDGDLVKLVSFINAQITHEYKDYAYDGNTVTYTKYIYDISGVPSSIRYYTLVYAD